MIVGAFQRGLLHPPPACRTALPDDRQGVRRVRQNPSYSAKEQQTLGSRHLGQSIADRRRKKTNNKTTNVVSEMLRSWQTESTVISRDFVRNPWTVSMDTVSRGA
jgi:hypothetical protein